YGRFEINEQENSLSDFSDLDPETRALLDILIGTDRPTYINSVISSRIVPSNGATMLLIVDGQQEPWDIAIIDAETQEEYDTYPGIGVGINVSPIFQPLFGEDMTKQTAKVYQIVIKRQSRPNEDWAHLDFYVQRSLYFDIEFEKLDSYYYHLPAEGKEFGLQEVKGNYPYEDNYLYLRFIDLDNNETLKEIDYNKHVYATWENALAEKAYIESQGGVYDWDANCTVPEDYFKIIIGDNSDNDTRKIDIQYTLDKNTPEWKTFQKITQAGGSTQSTYVHLTDWRVESAVNNVVNAYGSTVIVSLSGEYNEIPVRVYGHTSDSQEVILSEGVVKKGVFNTGGATGLATGFEGSVALEVPAYEENGWPYNLLTRYISYHYSQRHVQAYVNGEWVSLDYKDKYENVIPQPSFKIYITESIEFITKASQPWPFKIKGYWHSQDSNNIVRIRIVTNPEEPWTTFVMEQQIPSHDSPNQFIDYKINIPANTTGQQRLLYMMFSLDSGITWNKWYEGWSENGAGNGLLIQNG
ncbi:MAG: hypothetical protein LIP01_10280, partial [Tannerellaceae bacterium]|nr:hypothetical protein [Tannerellaceae bacterium]